MLFEVKLPPGVFRNGTDYQAKGRWADADLVRWTDGTVRPVGGWRQLIGGSPRGPLSVSGMARGSHAWRANDSTPYLAIGTHTGLFVRSGINAPAVISPVGLVAGRPDTQANTGFGGGAYGYDTYGTPRTPATLGQEATTWSLDNYGQDLVAVSSDDGRLLRWNLSGVAAAVVATSGTVPLNNKGVVVTDERFVMLLQAGGDRRRLAWCDQENILNWQITATTQAGDFDLQTPGEIMCAVKGRGQTLILTSVDAHAGTYLGPPLVYGFERVGTGCGAISRRCGVAADKVVFWMGAQNFYSYDGFVRELPCDVADHVFSRINRAQVAKVWATRNADFSEVTWFYPVGNEVDSYVTYNYAEGHWSIGSLDRTTGVDNSVWQNAIRVAPDGGLYEHEVGFAYGGRTPYAQTGPMELGQGEQVMMARYLYPDEKTNGGVVARFATRFFPNSTEFPFGPYSMSAPTSVRFTGRQAAMRIEGGGTDWRVGTPRLDVVPGGLR